MKFCAHAVPYKVANNAETALLAVALHRVSYIADSVAGNRLFNAFIKTLTGGIYQPLCLGRASPCNKSGSIIAVIAVLRGTQIYADNITFLDDTVFLRDAVNNFIVYGNTCGGGEIIKTQEIRNSASFFIRL